MLYPIKVIDIELSQSIQDVESLESYFGLKVLVRLYGVPLGYVEAPIALGRCTRATLLKLIFEQHTLAIVHQLLKNGLASPDRPVDLRIEDLVTLAPAPFDGPMPHVTVAVCTRDRPEDMILCLKAIHQLDYPHLDILVVDNAPQTESTKELIDTHYPDVRYIREPRPGLDWARNRAILEAKGDIIAYTDDDVVVDQRWVTAIAQTFVDHPDVMAVTGLVVPYELETEAQVLFEAYGGFGRGFEQKHYQLYPGQALPWQWLGGGQFGTGANMAFRCSVFQKIGYFDPALDVGTPTNGGGDLEMFIRVLQAEYALVYQPKAVIRHRHRREYTQLRRQISFNGSLYALWLSIAMAYPNQTFSCLKISIWWMGYWNIRRWIVASLHQTQFPKDLIIAELTGAFTGLTAYHQSTRRVACILKEHGHQTAIALPIRYQRSQQREYSHPSEGIAVRQIELSQPLTAVQGLQSYSKVRLFVAWHNSPFGSIDYQNQNRDISVTTLSEVIVKEFGHRLLDPDPFIEKETLLPKTDAEIRHHYKVPDHDTLPALPDTVSVSVVIATFDRPDDLRHCLQHLRCQQTQRPVEVIVVDNHPSSGLTTPIISDFPEVRWIQEPRQGLAYARNAGFNASSGDILIATDDDVTVPPNWIDTLVAPFVRSDVMIVTGNVLPRELETQYQQAFENYGGLGRGFERLEVSGAWYDLFPHKPSPTWALGATANAAFRATMFSHPEIGLMDECLGPGMPSGVGEDTYLFYKVLKADYTIIYEPKSYVWHQHRKTEVALKKQLYGYSKGHVSYNLTTWLRDGDWRGLAQACLGLPYAHYYRIKEFLLKRSHYPISLILLEMRGNLAGPWSLWRSRRRVRAEGRSAAYITPSQRLAQGDEI